MEREVTIRTHEEKGKEVLRLSSVRGQKAGKIEDCESLKAGFLNSALLTSGAGELRGVGGLSCAL